MNRPLTRTATAFLALAAFVIPATGAFAVAPQSGDQLDASPGSEAPMTVSVPAEYAEYAAAAAEIADNDPASGPELKTWLTPSTETFHAIGDRIEYTVNVENNSGKPFTTLYAADKQGHQLLGNPGDRVEPAKTYQFPKKIVHVVTEDDMLKGRVNNIVEVFARNSPDDSRIIHGHSDWVYAKRV